MNMSMTMKAGNGGAIERTTQPHVDYDKISIVFLANTAGYFLSSMSSSFMLHHFGERKRTQTHA
jgi:hypothetical protein